MYGKTKAFATLIAGSIAALSMLRPAGASDQVPAPAQTKPIALVGGTVHTVTGANVENGVIVFVGGKITAIGRDADIPAGAERISIPGRHVYPGLIAANTSLGLVEIGSVRATRDYAEVGDINPNVRAEVSVNPDSELLPVARANGLTMALTVPRGGVIAGTSALIVLDGWTWEDLTFRAPVGMHLFWPRMSVSRSPFDRRSKKERLKQRDANLKKIKRTFARARAYARARAAERERGVPRHESDMRWEAMLPVLNGDVPVFIHADGIEEIQAAVDWASAEKVAAVLVGGYDAWRVADLLEANHIPVIITGTHRTPRRRWEDYDAPFTLPAKLFEAGVKFCIATSGGGFGSAHVRNLPYNAATAAAYGLPKEEAIRAVTLYPAQILGVGDRVGSLEVGKDATLIVTDGDPLEITTQVVMEFIGGRAVDLSSRHTQLYEKYRAKYIQQGLLGPKRLSAGETHP